MTHTFILIQTHIYYDKCEDSVQWEESDLFNKWFVLLEIHKKLNASQSYLIPYLHIKSRKIANLNVNVKKVLK